MRAATFESSRDLQVIAACSDCQETCLDSIIEAGIFLPAQIREVLPALMQQCIIACDVVVHAISTGGDAAEIVDACGEICHACGLALQDSGGFEGCARACLKCGVECRRYVRAAKHIQQPLLV